MKVAAFSQRTHEPVLPNFRRFGDRRSCIGIPLAEPIFTLDASRDGMGASAFNFE